MLGFGLDISTRAMARRGPSPSWSFLSGAFPASLTLTRATAGTSTTAGGDIISHGPDVPRFDYDPVTGAALGLLVEPERTNLVPDTAISTGSWGTSGASASNLSLGALGLFDGCEITSNGATWHRINANIGSVDLATYTISLYYRAGTSNTCRVVLRDGTRGVESKLEGTVGALSISNQNAGTLTNLVERVLSDGVTYLAQVQFTPNATNAYSLGLGPNSATAGQTIIGLGAQVELGQAATSLIETSGGAGARSADVVGIYGISGTHDVHVTYGDGSDVIFAAQVVTDGYWPPLSQTTLASLTLLPV